MQEFWMWLWICQCVEGALWIYRETHLVWYLSNLVFVVSMWFYSI